MLTSVVYLNHEKLVQRNPRALKQFRRLVLGLDRWHGREIDVTHARDGSCCKKEPWNLTLQRLSAALHTNLLHVPIGGEGNEATRQRVERYLKAVWAEYESNSGTGDAVAT